MKNMKQTVILLLALVTVTLSYGQKLKSGSLAPLKGQKSMNVEYDYSQMKVGKKTLEQYESEGVADRNKKNPGSGDEWLVKWKSDRTERFQPAFERNFNEKTEDAGLTLKPGDQQAQYTMKIKIPFFEPGFQSGVGPSKPAQIHMVIEIVETADPSKVIATIDYPKIPSINMMGYDFDAGARVQSCFDRAGGNLGKFFLKNGLK